LYFYGWRALMVPPRVTVGGIQFPAVMTTPVQPVRTGQRVVSAAEDD
jgi:hypothetical protein